ncbi:MAG: formate transporter FocA [Thermodesulfobacteriota bacterium]
MQNTTHPIDALLPPEMAVKAEAVGVKKATLGWRNMFLLAVLAGGFIAFGAVFSTTVTAGDAQKTAFGVTRLLGGLVFSLGLVLVVIGGAELFTGNNMIVMAWASRKITNRQLLRNWWIVYLGNFVGSVLAAATMFVAGQYMLGKGAVGLNALLIADQKCGLDFVSALTRGILCNVLVCLAIWLCYSARSVTDKILSIVLPIAAFVAAGFEHSVANMYFIPVGLLIKAGAPAHFWTLIGGAAENYSHLTVKNFLIGNLLPVTIGNIIGGALLVGMVYWFIYIRKPRVPLFDQPHDDN